MVFELTGVLQRSAANQHCVTIPAATTLGEAIAELTNRHPQIGEVLLDNAGGLRRAHRLFLNGELIHRPDVAMPLAHNDQVEFLTAIAGG